jgi:hypothetical protein
VANSIRLELFCRLFLGLFVGFFCITALLFVRYKYANHPPQVTVAQSKGASQTLSGSAPAVAFSSASQPRPATPLLDAEQRTLLTSSASTLVAFIAAVVVNFMSWKEKRGRRSRKSGTPPSRLSN